MENQPQPNQMSKPTALVVIIVIIIILGVGGYFLFTQDEGTNTNNANTIANTNTTTNANVNAVAKINTATNTNTVVDTSGWGTYENQQWGYTFQYPPDMKVDDYSKYNSNIYDLNLVDDKIVPQPGGAIPIYVQVFNNSIREVKNAMEGKDETIVSWNEVMVSGKLGQYAEADHETAANEHYYVFEHLGSALLIKTTNPDLIIPTFKFIN